MILPPANSSPELAIKELEGVRARGLLIPEILEALAITYTLTGDLARAGEVANALQSQYPAYRAAQEVQAILDAIRKSVRFQLSIYNFVPIECGNVAAWCQYTA